MQQGVRAKVLDALCYASSDQGVLEECEAAWRSAGGKHQSKTKNKKHQSISARSGGVGARGENEGGGERKMREEKEKG